MKTITPTEIATANSQLRENRIAHGLGKADTAMFRTPLRHWVNTVNGTDGAQFNRADTVKTAAAIRETLGYRDAILCSTLAPIDAETALQLAADPHGKESVQTTYDILNGVFHNPLMKPDEARTQRALLALDRMIDAVPVEDSAQLNAVYAYLEWWIGDTEAAFSHAQDALTVDEEVNLAAIVATAVTFDVKPAYAGAAL